MTLTKEILQRCSLEELIKEIISREDYHTFNQKWLKFREIGIRDLDPVMSQLNTLFEKRGLPNGTLTKIVNSDLFEEIKSRIRAALLTLKISNSFTIEGNSGFDDRKDCFEITDDNVKKNVNCVALIAKSDHIDKNEDGFTTLETMNYACYGLCREELFIDQPILKGVSCTGVLFKEKDIIATANHIFRALNVTNVRDLRIIFGFKKCDSSPVATRLPNNNIYEGVKIIDKDEKDDWALIKLDRKASDQEIAKPSGNRIPDEQPVYIIGHPFGLPLKYASNAEVCVNKKGDPHFKASLDAYARNSGSPVFNGETHELEGILIHKTGDDIDERTRPTRNCVILRSYPDDCKKVGATVTRISELADSSKL
jgi:S1-C subfamily serine protease